jgi:hypothetical protein
MRAFDELRLAAKWLRSRSGRSSAVVLAALFAPFIGGWCERKPLVVHDDPSVERPSSRDEWIALERELTPDDAEAVVRLTLRNSYDTGTSLDLVDAYLSLVPPREVTIAAGQTISEVVFREYGFGPRDRPAHYKLFERAILNANGVSRPEEIRPGELLVPALPPIGVASRSAPGLGAADRTVVCDTTALDGGEAKVAPGVVAVNRAAWRRPARTVEDVRLPASAFSEFVRSVPDAAKVLFRDPNTVALSRSMLVVPAQVCLPSPLTQRQPFERLFTDAQIQDLKSLLGTTPHTVNLFVLDSAWPDSESYVASRAFLTDLIRRACRLYRIPQLARDLTRTADSFREGHSHTRQIRDSLQELAPLCSRVRIIYVPLTKDQGASDVLETILAVGAARDKIFGAVSGFQGPAALNDRQIAKIADEARAGLASLMSSVAEAPDRSSGLFVTNPAFIDSLYQIASDVSREAGNEVFVFNQSWTAPANGIPMRLGDHPRGLVVAAVGNDGRSVDSTEMSYATFAKRLAFVLAVMTLDRSGQPYCGTSCVDYTHEDMNAVGFDGTIPGDGCGSSFAAPRVAWLIAAREARRASAFPEDASKWVSEVRRRIRTLRPPGHTPPRSLLLDPVSYVRD